jgi:hypothetical protein
MHASVANDTGLIRSARAFQSYLANELRLAEANLVVTKAKIDELRLSQKELRNIRARYDSEVDDEVPERTDLYEQSILPKARPSIDARDDVYREKSIEFIRREGAVYIKQLYKAICSTDPLQNKTEKSKIDYAVAKAVRKGIVLKIGDKKPYQYRFAT